MAYHGVPMRRVPIALSRRWSPRARPLRDGDLRFTEGSDFALYESGRDAFPPMLEAIRSAEQFVQLETYILRADQIGSQFLEALRERAEAGCRVQLLYDALGSRELDPSALDRLRAAGAEVVVFGPLWPFDRRWSPRRRDHRKLLIVDGRVAFVGGLNLGDEYDAGPETSGRKMGWRDNQLRLTGPVVPLLGAVFLESWYRAGGPTLPLALLPGPAEATGSLRCAILPDGPVSKRRAVRDLLIRALDGARESVRLTSPYFSPGRRVLDALGRASERGVGVDLIVAGERTDHALLRRGARRSIERLLRRGVRVHEYEAGILHAKSAVFDGALSIVGSSNLDRQSLLHNFELNIVADEGELSHCVDASFGRDLARSGRMTLEALTRRPVWTRFVDWLAASVLSWIGEGDAP